MGKNSSELVKQLLKLQARRVWSLRVAQESSPGHQASYASEEGPGQPEGSTFKIYRVPTACQKLLNATNIISFHSYKTL